MRNDLKFTTAQFLAQNSFFWLRNHFFKFQVGGVGRNLRPKQCSWDEHCILGNISVVLVQPR